MRAIPTAYVVENSILGENLYNSSGNILVKKGTTLTAKLLKQIEVNKVYTLYIDDPHSDYEVFRLLEQSLRVKGALLMKELFALANEHKSILDVHNRLESYVNDVLYELKSFKRKTIEHIDIKNVDNYIYSSSINVALLSALIAWDLNYSDDMVKQIFIGALYHDIGIALLPSDVINKSGELSIDEKMMILNHPNKGHNYLKDKTFLSAYVKQIALHHHECLDGSGYPNRIKDDDISFISQIVGVADIYDAMTSDRPYKRAVPPYEALEYILGTGSKFDPKVINAFIKRITPYPCGSIVKLSNGKFAVVDEISEDVPLRPIVRIINKVGDGYEYQRIDLRVNNSIVIENISYDKI